MANQHTKAAEAAQQKPASDDGPDLGADTAPSVDVEAILAHQQELEAALEAARAQLAARPPLPRPQAAVVPVVAASGTAPAEPTYEAGDVDEEGVAFAGTIVCVGPNGDEVECTPKVFRTIMAAKGYVAHPTDAAMHLGTEKRRSRRRDRTANVDGGDAPEQATAARRRRRAPVAD